MTKAQALHEGKRGDERDEHPFNLVLFPEQVHLFALPVYVLQVLTVFQVLADNADAIRVVHGLIEEVTVELNDIRIVLSFE